MKILHIHPSLSSGGIEAMICGLANEMAKTENVTVCSIFEPKETDVFFHKLSKEVKIISCHKRQEGFSLKELIKIFWIIQKGKFDIVNMHGFLYYYILTITLSIFSKTKFFYTVHSSAEMESGYWDLKFIKIKRFFFKKNIVYPITISKASSESFTRFYHHSSKHINNGIITPTVNNNDIIKPYRITNSTKVFLHPGRISKAKNQVVLCSVFKTLIERGEDIVLLIAGGAEDKEILNSISVYFGERIIYLGMRDDVTQIMANCDAMCLSSIWEGLPITLLEALSVGCIPICSPVGGIVDVIKDGENGILSSSPSIEDYYQAVERFLTMTENEKNIIRNKAQESFKDYTIENTTQEYLKYYNYILK